MVNKGEIYICPTPIGNLDDITIRVLKTLDQVDIIGAEDTRRTIKLLNYYEIKNNLVSYHEHNENEKSEELIARLKEGKSVAIVSDAGMPGISDPGERIIKRCIEEEIPVNVLPGPTASITALISSGLDTEKFVFEGFLPSRKKDRQEAIRKLEEEERTLIFYESPYRLLDLLKDLVEILGNRQVSVSRELTKMYEEVVRGDLETVYEDFISRDKIRGEFVIILEGNREEKKEEEVDIKEKLKAYIKEGNSKSKSVKLVSKEYNLPRNEVYQISLDI